MIQPPCAIFQWRWTTLAVSFVYPMEKTNKQRREIISVSLIILLNKAYSLFFWRRIINSSSPFYALKQVMNVLNWRRIIYVFSFRIIANELMCICEWETRYQWRLAYEFINRNYVHMFFLICALIAPLQFTHKTMGNLYGKPIIYSVFPIHMLHEIMPFFMKEEILIAGRHLFLNRICIYILLITKRS